LVPEEAVSEDLQAIVQALAGYYNDAFEKVAAIYHYLIFCSSGSKSIISPSTFATSNKEGSSSRAFRRWRLLVLSMRW